MNMVMVAQREARWIDRVAGDYDDGSPAPFRVAKLFDTLYKTDDFAERLAHLDCDGECGARGHGNDPRLDIETANYLGQEMRKATS